MTKILKSWWVNLLVWVGCVLPASLLAWRWINNDVGFNWLETIQRATGDWTMRFLLLSLCITPLRRIPGLSGLIKFRRRLGLTAFSYGCLHLAIYLQMDKQWDWAIIWEDLTIRRFYVVGLLAFALLVPLALTSTNWAIRKLGKKWQRLHRLVYFATAAGIVHYLWQGKTVVIGPLIYAGCLAILMLYRLIAWGWKLRSKRALVRPTVARPA